MKHRIRPTTSKVRQALFNSLGPLEDRAFLDLFSGTGQIAFEAARRGASPVVAVELLREQRRELLAGAGELEVQVITGNVRRIVEYLARKGRRFDVIFADPPYGEGWPRDLLELLGAHGSLLAPGGTVVVEHSRREDAPEGVLPLERRQRRYGETVLSFFSPPGGEGEEEESS